MTAIQYDFAVTGFFAAAILLLVVSITVLVKNGQIANRIIWSIVVVFIPIFGPAVFFLSRPWRSSSSPA